MYIIGRCPTARYYTMYCKPKKLIHFCNHPMSHSKIRNKVIYTTTTYMGPTALRGIRATGDTLSNVESQVFTPYKFGSTAGDRTPDLLTTRLTCYHSASARCIFDTLESYSK